LILYTLIIPKTNESFRIRSGEEVTPIMKLANILGTELISSLPADYVHKKRDYSKIEELIKKSGNPWGVTAYEFFFLQFISAFIGFLASWVIWFGWQLVFDTSWIFFGIFFTVLGFFYPRSEYSSKAKKRDLEFKRELPEALDLMQIAMSSGQTLNTAIKSTYEQMPEGILKDEFGKMSRRIDSGMSMQNTLDHFAYSAPTESIRSFVHSI